MESQSGLGSMIQLKALGPQNEFTSACPSTSPFIKIYRQHFNFSNFQKEVKSPTAKFGDVLRFNIDARMHGDLLDNVVLKCKLPILEQGLDYQSLGTTRQANVFYMNSIGHGMIEKIEFKVGNQVLDTIDGDWLETYDNLYLSDNKYSAMNKLIQRGTDQDDRGMIASPTSDEITAGVQLYIPLRLFFENKPGNAFPFCALTQQRVQINIHTRPIQYVVKTVDYLDPTSILRRPNFFNSPDDIKGAYGTFLGSVTYLPVKILDISLIMNEYMVDDNLRDFFKTNPLSYLIKTNIKAPAIAFDGPTDFSTETKFRYYPDTNAVVSLFSWFFRTSLNLSGSTFEDYDRFNLNSSMTNTGVYMLNEWVDKTDIGDRKYWRYLQPLMHLPANPRIEIYTWSTGLKSDPTSLQDWGSIDFSRIKGREFYFEYEMSATGIQPTLFMNITNYLTVDKGAIQQFFIY